MCNSLLHTFSAPCKEKSTREARGKKSGRRGGIHDQVTRSAARVEKEFSGETKKESRGAEGSTPPRIWVADPRSSSVIFDL